MAEDLDIRDDKHTRPFDRAALGTTLLYSFGLGLLGFVIIAVGIVGAFQH
jgi:hypothetical protein